MHCSNHVSRHLGRACSQRREGRRGGARCGRAGFGSPGGPDGHHFQGEIRRSRRCAPLFRCLASSLMRSSAPTIAGRQGSRAGGRGLGTGAGSQSFRAQQRATGGGEHQRSHKETAVLAKGDAASQGDAHDGGGQSHTPAHAAPSTIRSPPQIMLFMKGSPDAPRCGFSRRVADLLRQTGKPFGHFDILRDQDVRQGLKVRPPHRLRVRDMPPHAHAMWLPERCSPRSAGIQQLAHVPSAVRGRGARGRLRHHRAAGGGGGAGGHARGCLMRGLLF